MQIGAAIFRKSGKSLLVLISAFVVVVSAILIPGRFTPSSYASELGGISTKHGYLFRGPGGVAAKIDLNGNLFIKGHVLQNATSFGPNVKGSSNWEFKENSAPKMLIVLAADNASSATGDVLLTGTIQTSTSLIVTREARFVYKNNQVPLAVIKSNGDLLLRGRYFESIYDPEEMSLNDNPYDLCGGIN